MKLIIAPTRAHAVIHAQNENLGVREYIPVTRSSQLNALRGGELVILGYPFGPEGWALRDAVAAFRQRNAT